MPTIEDWYRDAVTSMINGLRSNPRHALLMEGFSQWIEPQNWYAQDLAIGGRGCY